jgi:hypothetical protein
VRTRLLTYAECGCSSDEEARGWAAFSGEDTEGIEPTSLLIFCPVCAAKEFGYRPERAEEYTCAWSPARP